MKLGLIVSGAILAILVLVGLSSYISASNLGVTHETNIKASYENLQNILGTYTTKVMEAAKVPGMARDDLKAVIASSMSARYGSQGSQAAMQWIKEQYPGQVDPTLYRQIQQIIEGGRDKFQNEQTAFIEVKKAYELDLGYFWTGFWLSKAGYPKIDLKQYKTVTSEDAKTSFETGITKPVELR